VVVATGAGTYFGRTTQLVERAHPKLNVEEVTSRIVTWLLVIVGTLVVVTFVTALVHGQRLVDVLPVTLVLLMSAVPIALPVMFTVSMAVGSMELGRRGVLIMRLSAIEDAANMDVLCADKTGTLTLNQLSLICRWRARRARSGIASSPCRPNARPPRLPMSLPTPSSARQPRASAVSSG